MVNFTFNNRLSQFLKGSFQIDESFTRDDGIKALNMLVAEATNNRLNIRSLVERFIDPQQDKIDLAVITCIVFHLMHLDQPVTCEIVKPFLPWQADKELNITVQTPITAHIAKCQDCRSDVETIHQLNLEQKQIVRLGELYAADHHKNFGSCRKTQKAIPSIAAMNFAATTAKVLSHVCLCPTCRQLLCEERKEMLESLPAYDTSPEFPCESVSSKEIFVYTIPYGLDPANDQYAKFRPSFTSHLVMCQTCLEKVQGLHSTIYAILERPDSEVVTRFALDES
ncbi:hypothetical protein ACFL3G_12325 [Planctomycetota bacterium]